MEDRKEEERPNIIDQIDASGIEERAAAREESWMLRPETTGDIIASYRRPTLAYRPDPGGWMEPVWEYPGGKTIGLSRLELFCDAIAIMNGRELNSLIEEIHTPEAAERFKLNEGEIRKAAGDSIAYIREGNGASAPEIEKIISFFISRTFIEGLIDRFDIDEYEILEYADRDGFIETIKKAIKPITEEFAFGAIYMARMQMMEWFFDHFIELTGYACKPDSGLFKAFKDGAEIIQNM